MVAFFYAWVLVAVGINAAKADIDVIAVAYNPAACQYLFRLSQADACAGDDICLFHHNNLLFEDPSQPPRKGEEIGAPLLFSNIIFSYLASL